MRIIVASLLVLSFVGFADFAQARSKNVENASFNKPIAIASSSVVSVYATKNVTKLEDNIDAALYGASNATNSQIKVREENSLGSGVVVDSKGLVITNRHIVTNAQDIKIVTANNQTYKANVVDVDYELDLAILQISNTKDKFSPIEFADSDTLYVGDRVFALGNPFGIGQSASAGIVSAIGRAFNMESAEYLIQTDAAINPGNSGGALIDVDGKLVGINSAIFSKTEGFSGVGFAVPSNAIRFVLDTLATKGSIQKAWIGAKGQDLNIQLQKSLSLKSKNGVYINQVIPNSPAEKAGLQVGDVLIKLGAHDIIDNKSLNMALATVKVNKRTTAKVIRSQRVLDLEINPSTIEKRSESDKFMIRGNNKLSGIVVEHLSPELNFMLNLALDSKGVAIIDRPKNVADYNIQVGDVILQVNKTQINKIEDLKQVLATPAPYGLKLTILRAGKELKIFVN